MNLSPSLQYENAKRRFKNERRNIAIKALQIAKTTSDPLIRKKAMEMYHRNEQESR